MTKRKPKMLPKPMRAWCVLLPEDHAIWPGWCTETRRLAREWAADVGGKIIPVEIRPLRKRKGVRRG